VVFFASWFSLAASLARWSLTAAVTAAASIPQVAEIISSQASGLWKANAARMMMRKLSGPGGKSLRRPASHKDVESVW
jgi:hypothetical protein